MVANTRWQTQETEYVFSGQSGKRVDDGGSLQDQEG